LRELKGHSQQITSVAISADGNRIVTGSRDNTALVWDARTGQRLPALEHNEDVLCVALSADGRRVLTGSSEARLWDMDTGQSVLVLKGRSGPMTSVAFSADGSHVVTAGEGNGTVRLWDSRTGESTLGLIAVGANCVILSRDGSRIITGEQDNTVGIWDTSTGK